MNTYDAIVGGEGPTMVVSIDGICKKEIITTNPYLVQSCEEFNNRVEILEETYIISYLKADNSVI